MLNTAEFYGTTKYYKAGPKVVLTDGTHYVAETVGAYWLFQDTAVYLNKKDRDDGFRVITLQSNGNDGFIVTKGDGNGTNTTLFEGEFTDFPLEDMPFKFYASYSHEFAGTWIMMLTSEY